MKTNQKQSAQVSMKDKVVVTPMFRLAFPKLFKAESFQNQEPKYSLTMLYSKDTDLTSMKKAANAAAVEKWGSDKNKWPENFRSPFRDGDKKSDLQGYEGCIFVSASSKKRPGVVDRNLQPIHEEDQTLYAGCYARAEVIAFAYDTAGNCGVGFALQNVQKLKDGESFGGRRKPQEVFEAFDDGSDSEENYSDENDDEDAMGF